jgi:hypothetical protein
MLDVANDGNLLVVNVRFAPLLIHAKNNENDVKIQFSRRYKSFILVGLVEYFKTLLLQIPYYIAACIAAMISGVLIDGIFFGIEHKNMEDSRGYFLSLLGFAFYLLLIRPVWLANQAQTEAKNSFDAEISSANSFQLDVLQKYCFRAELENTDQALQSYAMRLFLSQVCDAVKLICARFA